MRMMCWGIRGKRGGMTKLGSMAVVGGLRGKIRSKAAQVTKEVGKMVRTNKTHIVTLELREGQVNTGIHMVIKIRIEAGEMTMETNIGSKTLIFRREIRKNGRITKTTMNKRQKTFSVSFKKLNRPTMTRL